CDVGVYWAFIPPWSSASPRTYAWSQAQGVALQNVTGLAMGPTDGTKERVVLAAQGLGIFTGQVPSATDPTPALTLQAAQLGGVDPARMGRTSLTAYPQDANIMYAVFAESTATCNLGPMLSGVLSSQDGGTTWTALSPTMRDDGSPLSNKAGCQGDYNNCIAV